MPIFCFICTVIDEGERVTATNSETAITFNVEYKESGVDELSAAHGSSVNMQDDGKTVSILICTLEYVYCFRHND
jgi:hypothetical protein